ncbi:MAG: GWxTD domain-containing protein [Ignavibacteria bacterium]|nr:GWxTD domain-containing protein [Ignavibacteria bacterium]
MKRICLIIFLFAITINAQVEYSAETNLALNAPLFYIDFANYKSDSPDKARLDVFVQIPNSSIQFIKKDNSFTGGYNVTLTFYDKDKKTILFERSWKEKIISSDFAQTISRNNFNFSYRTFDLNPGNYTIRCILEDSDSRRAATREYKIGLKKLSDSLALSDLFLITEIIKDPSGDRIVPNISKVVSNKTTDLPFSFEIYSDKDQQVVLEYQIENLKSKITTKYMDPVTVKSGTNQIYHTIENVNFKLGDYILRIVLKDKDWKEIASTEKSFISKIYGFPNSIADLDNAVEQLLYIASPQEISYIKQAQNYDEKLERFLKFWDTKKPNPLLEENPILYEYYRRVEYANKNFKGLNNGWRTDMGLIYITFGPPNNVERHPMEANSIPYEIWEYYDLNRSFIFADPTGFGDYRLVNPDYSRWPGYR